MNKIHVLTAISLGILASSSGKLQVQAATYNYFVDFSTKEVADFTAYRQTFNEDTSNLTLKVNFEFFGEYKFDSCPTNFTMNANWFLSGRISGNGNYITLGSTALPDFPCTTNFTYYETNVEVSLNSSYLDTIVNDDAAYLDLRGQMQFVHSADTSGRTLSLTLYSTYFDLTYDFGTTYLFNYFLSDQRFFFLDLTGSWSFNTAVKQYLSYVYTTAGNDSYYIRNTNNTDLGNTRKKYAIDYNDEFFRGQSVGAGFFTDRIDGNVDTVSLGSSGSSNMFNRYHYYYLNVANLVQPIVNVPLINFTTQNCSGGFLDINVGCFINNGLAYLTNTAPIISDATQLINAGISFVGQTFGVIGAFTTNNMFGYLVLGGFGFIVIKSLFKNDK